MNSRLASSPASPSLVSVSLPLPVYALSYLRFSVWFAASVLLAAAATLAFVIRPSHGNAFCGVWELAFDFVLCLVARRSCLGRLVACLLGFL
jgi:hypothetical protein